MTQDKEPLLKRFKESKFAEFVRDKVKPIAGDALSFIGDITGVETIEKVGDFLSKNKESNEQIKALDFEFQKYEMQWRMEINRMQNDFEIESLRLQLSDVSDARENEIQRLKETGGKRDLLMGSVVITGLVLMGFVIWVLSFVVIPEGNKELAYMSFGSVLTIGGQIFAYYVGSSKQSRVKDYTISRMSKQ